jgi:hypothetical protein
MVIMRAIGDADLVEISRGFVASTTIEILVR